jgi:hypothetical protein
MLLALPAWAQSLDSPLPDWLKKTIADQRRSRHPGVIQEATYEGRRVFVLTRGDRFDTGDEHILFAEDGNVICQFGGYVPVVTFGSCDLVRLVHVRALLAPR